MNVYKFTKCKQDLCSTQPRETDIFTTFPSNKSSLHVADSTPIICSPTISPTYDTEISIPSIAAPQLEHCPHELHRILYEFSQVFSTNKYNVPKLNIPPVKINTTTDKIIALRPYRVPLHDQQEIQTQIEQMIQYGIITPSVSPYASPITLVTKRDKTKRFCIDYRKLNEIIAPDVHPLPLIETIFDKLSKAKYYSSVDIASAYWQVEIEPNSLGLPCRLYCDASTQGIAGILKQVHPDGQVHPVQYFSRALRAHERNYTVSELECLAIVESVDKFRIYLTGFISTDIIKQHQPTASPFNIDTNGLHTITRKGVTKIIIPETLQHTLMNKVHQEYNHPGISQMTRIITTQYYWKGISKSIEKFVRSCHTCQIIKRPKGKSYGALGQIPPPQQPFDLISIDTIAGFSKYGHSKTYLHVIVDHLTRYAWTFPSKSTSTLTYIQTLRTVLQQGSPKRLLSDRAPAFTSEKFRKFLTTHGIQTLLTTSNNLQANGLIERLNATITGKLRLAYLENPKASWTQLVKRVTQTYNNTPHSVTSFPPTYLMFNVIPPDLRTHLNPYPEINIAREIASSRTQNKHKKDKETFDKQHRTPHFEVNDLVLVKNYRHPDTGKLAPYFTGPYKIIEIISPNVVRIDRPNQPLNRDSDTIHVNKLKYYTEDVLDSTKKRLNVKKEWDEEILTGKGLVASIEASGGLGLKQRLQQPTDGDLRDGCPFPVNFQPQFESSECSCVAAHEKDVQLRPRRILRDWLSFTLKYLLALITVVHGCRDVNLSSIPDCFCENRRPEFYPPALVCRYLNTPENLNRSLDLLRTSHFPLLSIWIQFSSLTRLPLRLFDGISFKRLYIDYSRVETMVTSDLFEGSDIRFKIIDVLNSPSAQLWNMSFLRALENMTVFSLESCNLAELWDDLPTELPNSVESLWIVKSKLTEIKPRYFLPTRIKYFHFNFNDISEVADDAFPETTVTIHLDFLPSNTVASYFPTQSRVLIIPNCMLQLPLKRLRFNQISPFASNNKKPRNDIATERLSRQDSEMELNQDPTGVKSDGPTETMERRQEVRESESARERQEVTGRETTAPLADAINQLSTFLTRVKISDGAESAIPPFDGAYSATQFFQTFDRKMEDASMGEQEKLLRLPNYLVRQPLELFRKLRLADRSYFQVRQILLDLYPESSEASFAKYFAMKLTGQANLETYYREKNRHGIATRTSTRGDPRDADRRTAIQRPAPSPRSASREPRRVVPTGTADPRAQSHPDAQVHGMHLFRRPTASSAARDTGTANADVDQSRRPTKKSGQCKRSQNHQFRLHHNQVKPETPQPDSPFETEVGSLNQLTVKLFLAPNVSCPFLIDTGASLSIVPYNIYHMLKTHLPNLTLEGHSLHLQTLNGFAKTMGKLSIPLTIGQISRKEYFHVVNAPLPFGILSINSLHKFRLTIDFNKCTIIQLGAPLSTLSYHFNHVSNVCTYWQCQAMSQKIFPTSQLSAYDNHCVHSLRKPHLSTCPFFTKANCPFYMPSNNQTTTTSTYEPVQNAPTQRDNSHTKNLGDHTPLHNSHMTNPHNELDTHTNTQQNPLPHAYYNTTPNTHYTPQFTTLLQRYTHIFSQDKFNVPCLRIPPVKIPTNSKKIITIRPYRVPICDQQEIRNQIQQRLENGIIEQSFSPFSSPVTLVTKRDKTKRFCIDYRKVNELISSDVHPLPRIEDILDRLAQAKYFSTADISSAYWQVPIHPDSRPLLAFATFEGLYQPTRLPFGLKTSPQIYERAISQVLQRHGLDCVAHYFDDFIIYSNTLEEHQNHLRQFFAFCEAEKLQLNFAKCEFFKQSINFLGYTITAGTISPLTRNTDIIHAIKQPHNRKTLQSFLGAVNVYNKFIPEYARLRAPLNNLLKKDVVWNWNEACQEAFIDLKGNLTQHPILHLYKEGLPCQVYCDASTLGIAGILKQVHPDGNVYPVQYFSRTLRPHEKNYSISELECLAIVESVEKFRIYLMGRKFTIFSDHHALQWLKTIKNPSGRLFRWSLRLSSYEYEVRYIKGKLQYEADLLSRNPFCGFLDATLIKTHQSPPSKESSLTIDHNGLHTVSRKGVTKIILPKPLIQQLLQTVHTQYNHPGISQMSRIISTQYYWQGMSKDIKQKVKTCPTCQLTKRPVGPTYGELSQPPESKEPFDLLSLDTIAGFAKYGNTKIYLHVVVDHFSRYAWAFPSKSTSTTTYQQVLKRVFQDGSPKRLLTDRAPAFTSPKFRSFLLNRNIHPLLTTSNNPQANGLCERLNATLTGKLRLLHLENPKVAWTKLVKKVTLIYNKTPHSTTGFPPIYLMFGILPPEISNHNTPYPDIDKARKIAHTRTQNKHLQDKNTYDQRHKQPHFEVGDLVLVKLYHHPNTGKLAPYFTGPHTILEIISPNVVRIDRPNQPLQRDTDTIHTAGNEDLKHHDRKYSPRRLNSASVNKAERLRPISNFPPSRLPDTPHFRISNYNEKIPY
ncbi:hypothetical protein LAZ67_2001693 [Cordylochernes scorpioides]|uniref:RNA-directed DNA polymerase n=1 Tax=Cordylochernes scorpioides TaxID=51811 RepID=A0ABY6K4Y9_9ARAC|nr:hypothetical protein LAZ67_2001693 [Cordylochernes scorpioides]